MAKEDIPNSKNRFDDQNTGPEDLNGGDIEDTSEGLETRTLIFLDGQFKGQPDELLVNKIETTGLEERIEIRLKTATACGHVLHTGSEAGLRCVSCSRLGKKDPLIFCSECAKNPENICFICNSVCCYLCRRQRRIDSENRLVCLACVKTTLRVELVKGLIKWLLIGAGILYLIMF